MTDIELLIYIRKRIEQLKSPHIKRIYTYADNFLTLDIIRKKGKYLNSANQIKNVKDLHPAHLENIFKKLRRTEDE